jgi:hypothetical protein
MKIFTEVFQKNGKLLNGLIEKGNQLYESIYFDFQSSYAYVLTSKVNARISFIWEKLDDNEIIDNFLISLESFIMICNLQESYEFSLNENNAVFTNGKEKYEFPYFKDDIDTNNFNIINSENLVILDKNIRTNYLTSLVRYADNVDTSNLYGVFIKNNKFVATDKSKLYEIDTNLIEKTSINVEFTNVNFPLYLAKIICLNTESEFKYNAYENFIHLTIDSNIDILSVNSKKLDLPDQALDNRFYNHETSFVIDKKDLFKVASVLDHFLKEVPNQRVHCIILEDELEINIEDFNKVKKFVKLSNVSKDLINTSFWISFTSLKNGLGDFKNDTIKVQISNNSPAINLSSLDEKEIQHIVLVRLKD